MSVEQEPCPSESCLLVPVPEAEPAVGRLRGRLDRAAAWGVPAHVTILYPFVLPDAITSEVIDLAAAAIASVPAFECTFARTNWFGEEVLWLPPEPDRPFRALTTALHAAFPQCPPFGGIYPDVVPHLTIGDRPPGGPAMLKTAEADVWPALPVRTFVSRVWLMTGTQAATSWQVATEFPLGAGDEARRTRLTCEVIAGPVEAAHRGSGTSPAEQTLENHACLCRRPHAPGRDGPADRGVPGTN